MGLLKGVLKTGYQRQLIAAALEFAIHQPDASRSSKPAPPVLSSNGYWERDRTT